MPLNQAVPRALSAALNQQMADSIGRTAACRSREYDVVQQADAADEAGASDGASQLIRSVLRTQGAIEGTLAGGGGFVNSPSVVAVYARDAFGNIAITYSGTAHLTTSDAQATLPADGAITNGVGFLTIIPRTLGNQTITATDAASASISELSRC